MLALRLVVREGALPSQPRRGASTPLFVFLRRWSRDQQRAIFARRTAPTIGTEVVASRLGGRGEAVPAADLDEAIETQLFFVLARRLGDAVGVEHQAVAGSELHVRRVVAHAGQQSQRHAGGAEFLDLPAGPQEQCRVVPGVGIDDAAAGRVDGATIAVAYFSAGVRW